MSFTATALNVMIASPGDVATERLNIRSVIDDWNAIHAQDRQLVLLPWGWETHASPSMGGRAQEVINKQVLNHCDLLVAVFWTRLGSPTAEAPSGTVEEINKHLESGKPAMIYFSNAPVRPDSVEEEQYKALRKFRDECKAKGLIETYESIAEFREKLARQLTQTILREFNEAAPSPAHESETVTQQPEAPSLPSEGKQLLLEASEDRGGTVLHVRTLGGTMVQCNGKQLATRGDPRSEAKWKAGIEELLDLGFLEERGYKGEVFAITNAGYEAADALRQQG